MDRVAIGYVHVAEAPAYRREPGWYRGRLFALVPVGDESFILLGGAMPFKEVPAKVDFPAQEREVLKFWKESHAFEKLRQLHKDEPHWSFIDGPITANNPMGVHHGWGRTYKDLFQRFWTMHGHELRYQNGFDCQGLWVEVEVEKELGFNIQEGHRGLRPGPVRAQVQGARAALCRRADRAVHPPGLLDGLERPRRSCAGWPTS